MRKLQHRVIQYKHINSLKIFEILDKAYFSSLPIYFIFYLN